MSNGVSKVLDSLTFQTDPVETLYLNAPRLHEQFVAHLGAIESFVRSVRTEGKLGTDMLVQIGGSRGTQHQVSWSLASPIAQALVLREVLAKRHEVEIDGSAQAGRYVVLTGRGFLVGGDYLAGYMRDLVDPIERGLYDKIESRRASQEEWIKKIDPDTQGTLSLVLVRDHEPRIVASFLDVRWIGGVSEHFDFRTEVFGVVRDTIGTAPLVSSIHAYVRHLDPASPEEPAD